MTQPLWTFKNLIEATNASLSSPGTGEDARRAGEGLAGIATVNCEAAITGVSIDTRTIEPGNLFVALKDIRDGHEFVPTAFKNGAAAALVSTSYQRKPGDGPLLHVPDVLKALEALGLAARARLSPQARVIAVTGSVGKTTTKEMLRACLTPIGKTHAADKSFNNHWGVPLTLARMPADTQYGVFEIGMNHAGEITPLTQMVRPHVAIVTTVEAVHLEHFGSVAEIAKAKAEIFAGLAPGGTAIIPRDNPHYGLLAARAKQSGVRAVSFGIDPASDVRLTGTLNRAAVSYSTATMKGLQFSFESGLIGRHMTHNALAVAASLDVVGIFPASAMAPLARMGAPQGRGSRTILPIDGQSALLIDESYNANPASMRAALAAMAQGQTAGQPSRLIAVLGDMLELGPDSAALHAGLADSIEANAIDLVFVCGPHMKHLYDALPAHKRAKWAPASSELTADVLACVKGGDVVMIKGSNGSRMAPLVAALVARHITPQSNG